MYTPFSLVFGKEVVVPVKFLVPYLCIVWIGRLDDHESIKEKLIDLEKLDEKRLMARWSQGVEKKCQKSWHDRHLKSKD